MLKLHAQRIFTALILLFALLGKGIAADKPNIVWLVSEDNSKDYLKLYDEGGAVMPTVEKLAENGIVFNNAFANSPVCSASRSTIISGCYGPRTFTNFHRRAELAPMPDGLHMFPYYLRQAGYYTSNNAKEDYNYIKDEEAWDASDRKASYRNRKEGQPFFHVQNYGTTHEGRLFFTKEEMSTTKTMYNPDDVTVFPYFPNTEIFRYTHAKYLDLHAKVDSEMAAFVAQLEEDSLMDETIIFYYGDHGGVLPRSKGYIYEDGLHTPLVVYVPKKWKHLFPAEAGSRVDGFVQFIDFAPTVLNLAGVEVPEQMDGKPFLGENVKLKKLNKQDYSFSFADRFDEKYDMVRAIRKGEFKYMRNYQPFNFDGLFNDYRYKMLAFREWRRMYDAGELTDVQSQFFETRPVECLYDIANDPHEINNLANDPAYKKTLISMRKLLQKQVKSLPDLSFYPESYLLDNAIENPTEYGQQHKEEIAKLVDIADLSLQPFDKAKDDIAAALASDNAWERYWGLIVCTSFGNEASELIPSAKYLSSDGNLLVRCRAAEFLAINSNQDPTNLLKEALSQSQNMLETLLILNSVVMLKDGKPGYDIKITKEDINPKFLDDKRGWIQERLAYLSK